MDEQFPETILSERVNTNNSPDTNENASCTVSSHVSSFDNLYEHHEALGDDIDVVDSSSYSHQSPTYESWFKGKGMHFVNLNIHFLYPKLDEIRLLISQQNNIHVISFCETFLNDTFSDQELYIDGYKLFRKDRTTHGGGLITYVKDSIPCFRRLDLERNSIESLWLEFMPFNSQHFLLCSSYRPPSSKNDWVSCFSNSLEQVFLEGKECLVVGDYNFDISTLNDKCKPWVDLMESLNFTQMVSKPTRVTSNTSTIIDHVFSNRPSLISSSDVKLYSISDHYPVCFTRNVSCSTLKNSKHKLIAYRSLKRFDVQQFFI